MTPGVPYATAEQVAAQWRPLSMAEQERVTALLPIISDSLRQEAMNVGKDLDELIDAGKLLRSVVASVTVDIVARVMMTPTDETPQTQYSQSALGYTMSGTFLVPGGGIFIKKSELARLGLRRQRIGVIDLYAKGRDCDPAGKG